MRPTIHLFADILGPFGGIETYLDALARRLHRDGWPVRVAVSLNAPAPFLEALEELGIPVYRQRVVPGDRWHVRQRLLIWHVARSVKPGDWVFCVRQPMAEIYPQLVRSIHRRGGKVAASWALAPEFLPPPAGALGRALKSAIGETDAVISVSECTRDQFRTVYDYHGPVHIVRYHNVELFAQPLPLPEGNTLEIGFLGRMDIAHKNLDTILEAFKTIASRRPDVRLNLHGGGPDMEKLSRMIEAAGLTDRVRLHGGYDHRKELKQIVERNHIFVYTSRFEGGPCLSLLELLQAGRFVVTSPVGGIPDIYSANPQAGLLVDQDNPRTIADALESALAMVESRSIDIAKIRAVYDRNFTEELAHAQFTAALGL